MRWKSGSRNQRLASQSMWLCHAKKSQCRLVFTSAAKAGLPLFRTSSSASPSRSALFLRLESFCAAEEANKERPRGSENEGSKRRARFEAASGERAANRGLRGMLTLSVFARKDLGRSRIMAQAPRRTNKDGPILFSTPFGVLGLYFPKMD